MSHLLPTDPVRGPGLADDAERSARVEQLLLSGLDRYFAGQYDDAINIWTRVSFLERDHDRARAYIERARRALAERQRESDEVLERGVDAYHAGDMDAARTLLTQAIEEGGASDRALVFLGRLGRLGLPPPAASAAGVSAGGPAHASSPAAIPAASGRLWVLAAVLAAAAVAAGAGWAVATGWPAGGGATAPRAVAAPVGDPLPMVRVSDTTLDRAAFLYGNGELRAALAVLAEIDGADPLRADADRLRAAVQQALLAEAAAPSGPGATP